MKHPKTLPMFWVFAASCGCLGSACSPMPGEMHEPAPDAPRCLPADLDRLVGGGWTGSLTYLDYTSGKTTTIHSTLSVARVPGAAGAPAWEFRMGYPDEPNADSVERIVLSDGGSTLDGAAVTQRVGTPGGGVGIVTEEDAEDDHRPARVRRVYTVGAGEFSLRKLVQFSEQGEFVERHVYRWER